MVDWKIDGVRYHLVRPLTSSELKGLDDALHSANRIAFDAKTNMETDRDPLNRQPMFYLKMKHDAVIKCCGLAEEKGGQMQIRHVLLLFDKLVAYSRRLKY